MGGGRGFDNVDSPISTPFLPKRLVSWLCGGFLSRNGALRRKAELLGSSGLGGQVILVLVGFDAVAVGAKDLVAASQLGDGRFEDVCDLLSIQLARAPAIGAFHVAIAIDVIEFEDSQVCVAAVQTAPAELLDG